MATQNKRQIEAAKLEAQAKAIRRAEKAFWNEVEERLDEVKERFDLTDRESDAGLDGVSGQSPDPIQRDVGTWT